KYNKRPSEIEVQLYKNNVKHGDAVKLNQANNWQYTFEDLIAWQSGNDIFWTVGEVNIPSGYDASYGYTMTVNGTKEAIIENKYIKPNPKPTDKPEDEPTVEPTAQPTATPVASPTATPQSSPVITPQESPAPGSTDVRPTSTPEYTSVVTMDDALVIQGSVEDAAVLSARRGLDFAILGIRRRPGTGDNAMVDWVILLLISVIIASISGYKIKRNRKKQ
ncbi:MAG: Cna B-type domain-containing protein, partial [Lachnospiraceae bacterium]|nr:Cna B-type domain-containing protein [Lachnospiraceae bacterium]